MKIERVRKGTRHRKDLGDVKALAESIREVGLLHPIVVTPKGVLIAGERRLEACRLLGWDDVPVTTVDLKEIVRGEYAENSERKDFLPTEIEAIRRALLPKLQAKRGKPVGSKKGETFPLKKEEGRTRDKIGAFAGVSGKTIEKIAAVVEAAEKDPEKFGELPAEMDKTGKVDGAYKKVKKAQRKSEDEERGSVVAGIDAVTDLASLIAAGGKFGCIYADPPWLYDNQGTRAATSMHYEGLSVEEICKLPVRDLAADDAHLHLWTTNGFLFECQRIFEAWGFEFKSTFVWIKPQMGLGNYWRNSHEILLTAVRGKAKQFNDNSLMSWLQTDRTEHSAKPAEVRQMIERASPGPRLEMFARTSHPGWVSWGNQLEAKALAEAV